ncbi:hypothetical protein ACFW04_003710 [Cataglyphis niger]
MVIKLDIAVMDHRHEQLENYALQIKMKETCHNLLQIAKKDREQAAKLLKRLKIANQTPKKTKQELIDGLGTLAKTLFGTIDADDKKSAGRNNLYVSKRNTQKIHEVYRTKQLQHAMKNQIKILNAIIAHVDNVKKVRLRDNEKISTSTSLYAIIKDFINDLTDFIAHITSAKSQTIDIKLISIDNIILDKETASQIPQGTYFPFQIFTENWRTIEKFLTISANNHDNANIFTIIKIPLTTFSEYEIIINYLIHYDDGALCEVQAYVQLDTYINKCNIRHIHTNTTICIALNNANSWLYFTRKKQTIEVTCKNKAIRKLRRGAARRERPPQLIVRHVITTA